MIQVMGIDWTCASLEQREQVMVPEEQGDAFLRSTTALPGVEGCVLLQTCNRFEVYLDVVDEQASEVLLPGISQAYLLNDEAAHRHLMEVASGLRSQILGEDQIITQVRNAVKGAREARTTTSTLETLFRHAVTAGKAVRTNVKFCTVAPSSAKKAVEVARGALQGLEGKRAVVIGNGEIGRLAAQHLVEAGCDVVVTMRTYRQGQAQIPEGCTIVAYAERLAAVEGCDVVISATKSPHFTLTADMFAHLACVPKVVVDLALPRDIEKPEHQLACPVFFDLDDLRDGQTAQPSPELAQAHALVDKQLDDFKKWQRGRLRSRAQCAGGIAVFAGTSEGRTLCDYLSSCDVPVTAFVATEYGSALLDETGSVTVRTGRLNSAEMVEVLRSFATVVDATHPFATQVSSNIYAAAQTAKARYVRLLRPQTSEGKDALSVSSMQEAAEFLAGTEGAVLLTIGSKELACFTGIPQYAERLYVRILPDAASLQHAIEQGFLPSHIICMQGPFSFDLNVALLRSVGAQWLVTKDTGDAGGFADKIAATEKVGARAVVIARPVEPVAGYTLQEVCTLLTGSTPDEAIEPTRRFPLFVDLTGKSCLVVGGGRVGMRRCKALQAFGAKVKLIAPEVSESLVDNTVEVQHRGFSHGDTEGMSLVVAATNKRTVNHAVVEECRAAGIPVNVSDSPAQCDFFFPALCSSAHLTAGVVSEGENHALVVKAANAIRATLKGLDI